MKERRHKQIKKLRAALGTLMLLLGTLVAPVVLATWSEADICAMACCVESGHCCCKPSKASVAGQYREGQTTLVKAEIATPCPAGCTTSQVASSFFQRDAIRTAPPQYDFLFTVTTHAPPNGNTHKIFDFASTPPRAPPVEFIAA